MIPWYGPLADVVLVVHAAFVAFVVGGGLLVWRRPRLAWLHLPAAAWGAYIEFAGAVCPLTPLEVWLRTAAGQAGYTGGFLEHYLEPILYPAGLDRTMQVGLGTVVVLLNGAVYLALWRRRAPPRPRG